MQSRGSCTTDALSVLHTTAPNTHPLEVNPHSRKPSIQTIQGTVEFNEVSTQFEEKQLRMHFGSLVWTP